MKILIIEDEVLAANKLALLILRYDANFVILEKIRSVEAAIEWFEKNDLPDLLFLDIHLLDGTCFDILEKFTLTCPVIFTTAYDTYALDAFQLPSIDYLLKPISFSKLEQALKKLDLLQHSLQKNQQSRYLNKILDKLDKESQVYKSRFMVKSGSKLFSISVEQICYFYSEDRISFLVTKAGKRHAIANTLDEIENLIAPNFFFRINRQMIIHIQSIGMVHKFFKGRLKIDLNPPYQQDVLVSSRRVSHFQSWLDG